MRLAAAHPDQRVVAVTHGGVIGSVLQQASRSRGFAFANADNASISQIVVVGDRWVVRRFNDTPTSPRTSRWRAHRRRDGQPAVGEQALQLVEGAEAVGLDEDGAESDVEGGGHVPRIVVEEDRVRRGDAQRVRARRRTWPGPACAPPPARSRSRRRTTRRRAPWPPPVAELGHVVGDERGAHADRLDGTGPLDDRRPAGRPRRRGGTGT